MESEEAELETAKSEEAADRDEQMRRKLEARKAAVEGSESSSTDNVEAEESPDVKLPVESSVAQHIEEDIPITPPANPTPEPAPSQESSTLVASSSSGAKPQPETKVFRMDDDDEVANSPNRSPVTSFEGQDGAGAASVVPPGSEMSQEIRRRFQFLCPQDQKTTVKRECQIAAKREEALIAQLRKTVASYTEALELSRVAERLPDGLGPTLSPEAVRKYEDRIKFLRGTLEVLEAEPPCSLPKLSALEQTKGLAFAAYAQTASGLKSIGDDLGLLEPPSEQAAGTRGAWTDSFNGGTSTTARRPTVDEFLGSSSSSSPPAPATGTTTY